MSAILTNPAATGAAQLVAPTVPREVILHDDGSWLCSGADLARLRACFARFGVRFNPLGKFLTLRQDVDFMRRTATLLKNGDAAPSASSLSPAYVAYLDALKLGDTDRAAAAYDALRAASLRKSNQGEHQGA